MGLGCFGREMCIRDSEQVAQFEKALTTARSVTTRIYDRASGGAEHCQFGAQALWHADFFDWMSAKFGDDRLST